jgi:hypothetical protein
LKQKLVDELPRYVREGPVKFILDSGIKKGYLYLFSTAIITAEIHPETGDFYFDNYFSLAGKLSLEECRRASFLLYFAV